MVQWSSQNGRGSPMQRLLGGLMVPLVLLLAACVPSTSAPAAGKPAEKMHLVFGGAVTPPNMVHLAPYVAKDAGFFDELGLDVQIKSFEGGVPALRGGISGGLDVV